MAQNLLITSLENAFVSLILPAAAPYQANVYPGHASSTKALPCVICSADGDSTQEDPPHQGNFWVDLEITVKASAATEADAVADPNVFDLALTKAVFDAVKVNNLDALINALGYDLTILPNAFFFYPPKAGRDQDGVWVDQLTIKVYCCASIIPP